MSTLRYEQPATAWLEALPLGNGKLGAMCWGGTSTVRFDLNDETAWSGSPQSESKQGQLTPDAAAQLLAESRALLKDGRSVAAEAPIQQMQSAYTQAYLPLGTAELTVTVTDAGAQTPLEADYLRTLDLADAVHAVGYRLGEVAVTQRTIVSAVHGVMMHIIDGLPESASLTLDLTSPLQTMSESKDALAQSLVLRLPSDVAPGHETAYPPTSWSEEPGESLEAAIVARIASERTNNGALRAVVYLSTETTYSGLGLEPSGTGADAVRTARERVDAAAQAGSDAVLAAHVADHRALFDRVRLTIAPAPAGDFEFESTDHRIRESSKNEGGALVHDPALASVLFDFGRYLLIASSRSGGLPATLQGIWNDSMQPPWSSNYTTNINLEMNYWAAEVANLAETAEPLIDFIEALAEAGTETASRFYGARGWVGHHNSDAWLYTAPVGGGAGSPSWAFWPMAGAWLVRHLGERIEFGSADEAFMRDRAWPLMRSQCEFVLDWMQRGSDGEWETAPSSSPENTFDTADGPASLGRSSAMDVALIRELFETAIATAATLGAGEDPVVAAVLERLPRLPEPCRIGADGAVMEWADEVTAVDPHHRHLSLLYFLYPGTSPLTAAQEDAATRTLELRGDDSTGWSLVWKIALWARLRRADKVSDLMRLFFRPADEGSGPWVGGLYPNAFAAHPPFQIDGNLGFVAALAETLVQSHGSAIELLPALPIELANGTVSGLIARPGVELAIEWSAGELVEAILRSRGKPHTLALSYRGRMLAVEVDSESDTRIRASDF